MSDKSNNQGRAYEYVLITELKKSISKFREVEIIINSSFSASKNAYNLIDEELKEIYPISAKAAIKKLYEVEPLIKEGNDLLELSIQKDEAGKEGDVRDILIIRKGIEWEIGLSVKHNHFAIKHSRLSPTIDFGKKWYGKECSQTYWEEFNSVMSKLDTYIDEKKEWKEVINKDTEIYVPVLNAFIKELKRAYDEDNNICKSFAEFLLGEFDFYKVISIDRKRETEIQAYNYHGTLNKYSTNKPIIAVPLVELPDEIYHIGFKKGSNTTIEIAMNNGWSFSLRIHSAETKVVKSLKFDITFVGVPVVLTIDCPWD